MNCSRQHVLGVSCRTTTICSSETERIEDVDVERVRNTARELQSSSLYWWMGTRLCGCWCPHCWSEGRP